MHIVYIQHIAFKEERHTGRAHTHMEAVVYEQLMGPQTFFADFCAKVFVYPFSSGVEKFPSDTFEAEKPLFRQNTRPLAERVNSRLHETFGLVDVMRSTSDLWWRKRERKKDNLQFFGGSSQLYLHKINWYKKVYSTLQYIENKKEFLGWSPLCWKWHLCHSLA